MSSAQQATPEGSIVVRASATPEGSIIVHATPEAQPVIEAREIPNGSMLARHVAIAMQRKAASTSPNDQIGMAANMQQVGHTRAIGDIFYGRT